MTGTANISLANVPSRSRTFANRRYDKPATDAIIAPPPTS